MLTEIRKTEIRKTEMKITIYKQTDDQWHQTYKLANGTGLVRVMFTQTGPDPENGLGDYRVAAWGNDDFGLECDFGKDKTTALDTLMEIILMPTVSREGLKALGFTLA